MRFRLLSTTLLTVSLAMVGALWAAGEGPGDDVKCPISGKAVKANATAEFNGGVVYFCCQNCPKAFNNDKAKFTAKANHQMAQTHQLVQVCCPLTKKPCNPQQTLDIDGVTVAFCCKNCKAAMQKLSADEQEKKVFGDVSKTYKLKSKSE